MNTEKCTIELLTKCKIGFNDKNYANTMKNELDRVLAEDKQKRLEKEKKEKEKKEKEKMEIITNATPIEKGVFKEVTSF